MHKNKCKPLAALAAQIPNHLYEVTYMGIMPFEKDIALPPIKAVRYSVNHYRRMKRLATKTTEQCKARGFGSDRTARSVVMTISAYLQRAMSVPGNTIVERHGKTDRKNSIVVHPMFA